MLMSAITPLSKMDEINYWENIPFTVTWPEKESNQNLRTPSGIKRTIRKKPKRVRTAFTTEQLRALEQSFKTAKYIDSDNRKELANRLSMEEKVVKIWFQNRRMKEKRDSESSFDSSSEINATSPDSNQSEHVCTQQANVENNEVIEEPQYQFPNYVFPDYPTQALCNDAVSFGYDTNVYPTQYYPNDGQGIMGNGYACNYTPYYNSYMNNYWQSNNFEQGYEYY